MSSWALRNNKNGFSGGSTNSQATSAFDNPLTPGSIIFVALTHNETTGTLSVTDTAGNIYLDSGSGSVLWSSSGNLFQLFYAVNTHNTASNIVTGHSTVAASFFGVTATEFTGNAFFSPIDKSAKSVANTTTSGTGADNITTASVLPSTNGELIFAVEGRNSGTVTAGTNFTIIVGSPTEPGCEYLIQATAASVAGTFNDNTSGDAYACMMVAVFPAPIIYMLGHT